MPDLRWSATPEPNGLFGVVSAAGVAAADGGAAVTLSGDLGWGVFDVAGGVVHVVPTDADGKPLPTHRPAFDCDCQPRLIKDHLPLDGVVVSHRDPAHPGSVDRLT